MANNQFIVTTPELSSLSPESFQELRKFKCDLTKITVDINHIDQGQCIYSYIEFVHRHWNELYSTKNANGLADELTPYISFYPTSIEELKVKCQAELNALRELSKFSLNTMLSDFDKFVEFVKFAHSRVVVGGVGGNFRTMDVRTTPDTIGNFVKYPPAERILPQLIRLHASIMQLTGASAIARSAVLLNGIVQIHPFSDGNGRTSRLLFNYMMSKSSDTSFYLPISCLSSLSGGSFIIKLNRIRFERKYSPLLLWLVSASQIWNDSCRQALSAKSSAE